MYEPYCLAVAASGIEHWRIGPGATGLRLDIVSGTLRRGPVHLHYHLDGVHTVAAKLGTLTRLLDLQRSGRLAGGEALSSVCRRHAHMLHAHDLRQSGASLREIAILLFGEHRVASDWAGSSDYLKSRVRRLLSDGQALASGGYRTMLGDR